VDYPALGLPLLASTWHLDLLFKKAFDLRYILEAVAG
jgi:hypothetical protein